MDFRKHIINDFDSSFKFYLVMQLWSIRNSDSRRNYAQFGEKRNIEAFGMTST